MTAIQRVGMERVVTIEGQRVRVGSAVDAGRLCVSPRSPEGIGGPLYQHYASGRARVTRPAPGPLQITDPFDPTGKRTMPLLYEDGLQYPLEFLDEPLHGPDGHPLEDVVTWNRDRPGRPDPGRKPHAGVTAETIGRTDGLHRLLVAARDGLLTVQPGSRRGWITAIDGAPLEARYSGQMRSLLVRVGAIPEPDPELRREQKLPLLDAGAEILTRWGDTPP